jgi:hypothetical protein
MKTAKGQKAVCSGRGLLGREIQPEQACEVKVGEEKRLKGLHDLRGRALETGWDKLARELEGDGQRKGA